jgi:y4mF family transcriptional regulator
MLGTVIRSVRKRLGVTQEQLALASGTHRRFIVELERGKATAQVGKVLQVLRALGVAVELSPPPDLGQSTDPTGSQKVKRGSFT